MTHSCNSREMGSLVRVAAATWAVIAIVAGSFSDAYADGVDVVAPDFSKTVAAVK